MNGNSYTVSTQSDVRACVCTYVCVYVCGHGIDSASNRNKYQNFLGVNAAGA